MEPPGLPPAPLDDPLSYPGLRAVESFRLTGDELRPLAGRLPAGRRAVLAIGSNACPGQLVAKFRGRACSDEFIGFVVTVGGLQIRPSAHLGRAGYWPFAPAALDGSRSTAVLCLFDEEQLAVLDATEPNYDRIRLDPTRHGVRGAPDDVLAEPVEVYASKHGVVDDTRLPAFPDSSSAPPSGAPPSQAALLGAVLPLLRRTGRHLPTSVTDAASLSSALRNQPGLAARLTDVLRRTVVVRTDGLRGDERADQRVR